MLCVKQPKGLSNFLFDLKAGTAAMSVPLFYFFPAYLRLAAPERARRRAIFARELRWILEGRLRNCFFW